MTNREYEMISEALEKCKEDIENSFERFDNRLDSFLKSLKGVEYPDAFLSEKEQQTNESDTTNTH